MRRIFDKGYRGVFIEEVFVVVDRFRREFYLDINLYCLKDLNNRSIENSIYYENELLKVELFDKFVINRILKCDRSGRKKVSLKDFFVDFSMWM